MVSLQATKVADGTLRKCTVQSNFSRKKKQKKKTKHRSHAPIIIQGHLIEFSFGRMYGVSLSVRPTIIVFLVQSVRWAVYVTKTFLHFLNCPLFRSKHSITFAPSQDMNHIFEPFGLFAFVCVCVLSLVFNRCYIQQLIRKCRG